MNKVLIVEDEMTIRKGLSFLIDWSSLNCSVTGMCADGHDGLAFIQAHQPDLVITDVRMPLLDGIKMLEQAVGTYPFEAIIISGYEDFEYAKQAIRLGVSDYILKPIDHAELAQAVAHALQRLRQKKALSQGNEVLAAVLLDADFFSPRPDNAPQNLMDAAVAYIAENYMRPIQTADLCDVLGVSKTTLNQKFKEASGHTVNSFINRYRMTKALALMQQGNLRISEIAEAVGYRDYKYFFEVFRKYMGCSPTDFMQTRQ